MKTVERFAGAGGFGPGLGFAGFESEAAIEWNRWACDTPGENKSRGYSRGMDRDIFEGDARSFAGDESFT